jgi:hypothetical protein
MNPRDEMTRADARGSCVPRDGVGSFLMQRISNKDMTFAIDIRNKKGYTHSSTKNGLSVNTSGSLCER